MNPYSGYAPSLPKGQKIDFANVEKLLELEEIGLTEMKNTGFVLVAGGLGERLGYNGIKVELPIDSITNKSFLQYYIENILAFEKLTRADSIPFAIMVSDDTERQTIELLEKNNYFGMKKENLSIMK